MRRSTKGARRPRNRPCPLRGSRRSAPRPRGNGRRNAARSGVGRSAGGSATRTWRPLYHRVPMTTTMAGVDRQLTARDLEPILEVSAKLAAPFDLTTMLSEVVVAAKQVLKVDPGTVWLYDRETDEVVLRFSEDIANLRIPAGTGIV